MRRHARCRVAGGGEAPHGKPAGLVFASLLGLAGLRCEPTYLDAIVAPDAAVPDAAGCPEGQQLCSGACVSVATDPDHCGTCDRACQPTEVCSLGTCDDECAGSLQSCSGACVDLQSNDEHCGECDQPCLGAASCSGGACVCPGQGTYCSNACVNTESSHEHCGGCDQPCESGQNCIAGRCE